MHRPTWLLVLHVMLSTGHSLHRHTRHVGIIVTRPSRNSLHLRMRRHALNWGSLLVLVLMLLMWHMRLRRCKPRRGHVAIIRTGRRISHGRSTASTIRHPSLEGRRSGSASGSLIAHIRRDERLRIPLWMLLMGLCVGVWTVRGRSGRILSVSRRYGGR